LHNSPIVRAFNRWALYATLEHYQRELGLDDPILWAFLPTAVSLAGRLDESLLIYHCVDDYSANPGVPTEQIRAMEREILSRAELVFVTSPKLYRDKAGSNPHTNYFGNVANIAHFAAALDETRPVPEPLQGIPRPIIGYQGNISSYKTDLELLAHVARSRPQWSLVLVGPTGWGDPKTDVRSLSGLPNVHLLGRVDYADLPRYVAGFDVALIPFRVSESTQSSFPMKFFEYLALGKPVVSTALDALSEYTADPGLCRVAVDPEQFVARIDEALAEPDAAAQRARRQAVARENDWEARVEQISAIVQRRLQELGR